MEITTEEIYAYRELYYEHIKPMVANGKSLEEMDACVEFFAPEYGITPKKYYELSRLDLLQRIAGVSKSEDVKIKYGGELLSKDALATVVNTPELRCPRRSEQLSNPLYETDGN